MPQVTGVTILLSTIIVWFGTAGILVFILQAFNLSNQTNDTIAFGVATLNTIGFILWVWLDTRKLSSPPHER